MAIRFIDEAVEEVEATAPITPIEPPEKKSAIRFLDDDSDFTATPLQEAQQPGSSLQTEAEHNPIDKFIPSSETVRDVAFPTVGGVLGQAVGIPVPVGAAGGKAIQETFENIFLGQEKKFLPTSMKDFFAGDNILRDTVFEGVATYAVPKVAKKGFDLASPAVKAGFKAVAKPVGKVAQKLKRILRPEKLIAVQNEMMADFPQKGDKVFARLGDYLQGVIDEVPKDAKERVIRDIALNTEKSGLKRPVTQWVLERSPAKVLTEANLATDAVSVKTARKAATAFDDAFEVVGKQFDEQVEPILNKAKGEINITDIVGKYAEEVSDLINTRASRRGTPIVESKLGVDDAATRQLKKLAKRIFDLQQEPTAKNLHLFRKDIRRTLQVKSVRDSPAVQKLLFNTQRNVADKLESSVPGYQALNQKFRNVFALEEQIGKKVTDLNIEALARDVLNPQKAVQKDMVMELARRSGNDDVLKLVDETAAKEYISTVKKDFNFSNGSIGGLLGSVAGAQIGGGAGAGIGGVAGFGLEKGLRKAFGRTSRRQIGKELLKLEQRGFRTKGQRAIRGGLQGAGGSVLARPFISEREGLQ